MKKDTELVYKGQYVNIEGIKIWVMEVGEGPPLLLLHGLAASSETWMPVLPGLAASYRVIAPDLPGCRRSDKPDTGYEAKTLADIFVKMLDALNLPEVNLLGHSLGGHIALAMALAHPDRVRSLVLVDAAGLGVEVNFNSLEPLMKEVNEENVRIFLGAAMLNKASITSLMVKYLANELSDPSTHRALYVMVRANIGHDGQFSIKSNRLKELKARTLFVWGEEDSILPLQQGKDGASLVPLARFVSIPECGHCPHLEQPQAFADTVLSFLSEKDDGK